MKLSTYTFDWDPDKYGIPEEKRIAVAAPTYSSIAFFSWGSRIIGQRVLLEWDWMSADQYLRLKEIEAGDAEIEWDTEAADRLFYRAGANIPFVTGKVITGTLSGATATISAVDTNLCNLTLTGIIGVFQANETFSDNSVPAKAGIITSLEVIPVYNTEVMFLDGEYFEVAGADLVWRRNVKLELLIISEA
jgi:hypothetical protein